MKTTLLTLLFLLIQICNGEKRELKTLNIENQAQSPVHGQGTQLHSASVESENSLTPDKSNWEVPEKESKQRSVVGTAVKVVGITLLSAAGLWVGFLALIYTVGPGGC